MKKTLRYLDNINTYYYTKVHCDSCFPLNFICCWVNWGFILHFHIYLEVRLTARSLQRSVSYRYSQRFSWHSRKRQHPGNWPLRRSPLLLLQPKPTHSNNIANSIIMENTTHILRQSRILHTRIIKQTFRKIWYPSNRLTSRIRTTGLNTAWKRAVCFLIGVFGVGGRDADPEDGGAWHIADWIAGCEIEGVDWGYDLEGDFGEGGDGGC